MNIEKLNTVKELENWANSSADMLALTTQHGPIQLEANLRHLPTRRLTCRAQWQNKRVIAKFFYGAGFKALMFKEALMLQALKKSSIKVPELLHSEQHADYGVLVIQYIEHAQTLSSFFLSQPEQAELETKLLAVTELVLLCQQAGFEIKDPHLDNFLCCQGDVYLIDAGDIKKVKNKLSAQAAMQNLALFYAQLPVTLDQQAYQLLTKMLESLADWNGLSEQSWRQALLKQRRWRQKRFINKKVFRSCTAYICEQNTSRFLMAKRANYSEQMAVALSDPDKLIAKGRLLKDGATATVAQVEIAGQPYVLKRYNIKKPIHALLRGFCWSRAAISWKNGLLLEMLGIPTAKSYAMIEERKGALRRRSYLLSEYIDAPRAWDIYEDDQYDEENKKQWAKKIYELFLLLKLSQISHGDLKAHNILCSAEGAFFIDLDGLKSNQNFKRFQKKFAKDLRRFQISWPDKWKENPYFIKFTHLLLK